MCKWQLGMLVILSSVIAGCGGGDEVGREAAHTTAPGRQPPAATTDAETTTATVTIGGKEITEDKKKNEEKSAGFAKMFPDRDPFAAPAALPEPELDPVVEIEDPTPELPPLRLIGFINVDSARAMLKIDDELVLVGAGDVVGEVEILAVNSPALKLRFGEDEIDVSLFTQNSASNVAAAKRGSGVGGFVKREESRTGSRSKITVPPLPRSTGQRAATGIPGLPGGIRGAALPEFPAIGVTPPPPPSA